MSESRIKFKSHKNGAVTISGLAKSDLRLIRSAIYSGAYDGGDHGGPVSKALDRFGSAVSIMAQDYYTPLELVVYGNTSDPERLFEEPINLGET